MSPLRKTSIWLSVVLGVCLIAILTALYIWNKQQPLSLRGAILVRNLDPGKQLPIANVEVSADSELSPHPSTSNNSGLFVLQLRKRIRRGHRIVLHFQHPQYHSLDLDGFVQDKLYVVYLVPLSTAVIPQGQPKIRVTNIRVRYTVEAMTELDVGSAAKTFEIKNEGNVPCKGQHPCSPDGKWKAALGSGSLDAGPGRMFRDARVSCIAGPCPFTRIESMNFSKDGQIITVNARDWSDTATFLLEAEVSRKMVGPNEHWSYPVIFSDRLSFTLPADAQSVSIEADLNGQTIIFPLGPSLFLSWATCDNGVQDNASVYRCALNPGYHFD